MRSGRGAGTAAILAAAMLLAGGAARADSATCEIPIVHATPGGSGTDIDSKIELLKPYLSKPPFTAWHEFKMLDRKVLTLADNAQQQFTLPNGRTATLTFLGHTPGPGEHRMRLRLFIDHPEKKHRVVDTTFVLDEGGVTLQGGTKHEGGVLILGISCKTRD
jgi:hypothetical protein